MLLRCPNNCKATFDGYNFVEWHVEINEFGDTLGDMAEEDQPMEGELGDWREHTVHCNKCGEEVEYTGPPPED